MPTTRSLQSAGLTDEATADWIMEILKRRGRCTIALEEGQRAWNPASTRRMIYGPALIEYRQHPDGGIEAKVR